MRQKKNAYKILVRKTWKRALGRPRHRWEDNIRIGLREIGWEVWTGSIWLRMVTTEHGNEPLGSIKVREFDKLSDC
jgi:hypothetical protein